MTIFPCFEFCFILTSGEDGNLSLDYFITVGALAVCANCIVEAALPYISMSVSMEDGL